MPALRDPATIAATIAAALGVAVPESRVCPAGVPDELARWHCYTAASGHSVVVAVAALLTPGTNPLHALVAAPVNAVTRTGWRWDPAHDLIVADLPYDSDRGVLIDPADIQP
ncbi:hypothetical protein GCM10010123_19370 [Pilimelia anulata]|uniref:Uncharacterized protein n=1 Tax=Pilimelia anulata TaxID=53371 RepID=A0A8J3F8U2_9ACTN|nr:hypothetical protein [Pilimelia anulata]GGJ89697.1 hypothetical protein GCM10010123_19370 [Pilimelia anulata]